MISLAGFYVSAPATRPLSYRAFRRRPWGRVLRARWRRRYAGYRAKRRRSTGNLFYTRTLWCSCPRRQTRDPDLAPARHLLPCLGVASRIWSV